MDASISMQSPWWRAMPPYLLSGGRGVLISVFSIRSLFRLPGHHLRISMGSSSAWHKEARTVSGAGLLHADDAVILPDF